jgi:predicted nucleotidyltransferase
MLSSKLKEVVDRNLSLTEVKDELTKLLLELDEKLNPKIIIVAGSAAKGEFIMGTSDIDILIVSDKCKSDFILKNIKNINIEISAYGMDEALTAIKGGNQFIIEAFKEGIIVKGEEHAKAIVSNLINAVSDDH